MAVARDFYTQQADICARAAEDSTLPMLRDKFNKAGAAWMALANRENDIAKAREVRIAETAAKEAAQA